MYIVVTYSIMMYKNELTYHSSLLYRVHAIFLVDAGAVFVLYWYILDLCTCSCIWKCCMWIYYIIYHKSKYV